MFLVKKPDGVYDALNDRNRVSAKGGAEEMRKKLLQLIPLVLLCFCGCGNKDKTEKQIVNWTLPDVAAFEEAYTAEQTEQKALKEQQTEQSAYRWNPHGVFTYVTSGGSSWSTALFNVSSVDYEKHCAVVTYIVKDSNGYELARQEGKSPREEDYFFDSNGERVVGLDETLDEDGTRHIILYLSNEHYLEFIGKDKLETSKYCYLNMSYRLKREG